MRFIFYFRIANHDNWLPHEARGNPFLIGLDSRDNRVKHIIHWSILFNV
jgi:hypothetical protein